MTRKPILVVCALMLLVVGIASAKSYTFTLTGPATLGVLKLKEGEYSVKVNGTTAVITNPDGKDLKVALKVENGTQKYNDTTVETSTKDGSTVINAIDLQGTTTKLVAN